MNKYLIKLAGVYLTRGGREKYITTFLSRAGKNHKKSSTQLLFDAFKEPTFKESLDTGRKVRRANKGFNRLLKKVEEQD